MVEHGVRLMKSKPKALSKDQWIAHLQLRAALIEQVAACIQGSGSCSDICGCVGDSCKCLYVGYVPRRIILPLGSDTQKHP